MNARFAFVAAPLLTLAYGVIRILDGLDGVRGPGIAWTTGHLAFIAALVFFGVTFSAMRDLAGRGPGATISAIVGYLGIAALIGQFGIDIYAGAVAADHDAMGVVFDQFQAIPGVQAAVYDFGPFLFFIAQIALVTQLAVQRQVKAWLPVLVLIDAFVPFLEKDLMPIGALLLLVSYVSIARLTAKPAPAVLAHA